MDENRKRAPLTDEELGALSVEKGFELLDEIASEMEGENATIEESFHLYQEGMRILKSVSDRIDDYEKKMKVLTEDGTTEEFE